MLFKFKKITGATIEVITYNEQSNRHLKGGLSHFDFIEELNKLIHLRHYGPFLAGTGQPIFLG
jgi:uncharacterized protein YciI